MYVGESIKRREDARFLTGRGTYVDDYGMPRASDLPSFRTDFQETPAPSNPLGAKGAGESGTLGAPPAIVNAVSDALNHLGVHHIDMPLTPDRIWQALKDRPELRA